VVSDYSEVVGQTLPSKPMLSTLPMRSDMTKLQHSRSELFRSSQGNPTVPQGSGAVRRVFSIRQLPPLANPQSALNTNVDLYRSPQSQIIPRVQRNGSLNINSNDLTFDDKKIRINKNLKLSKNPNEIFLEGDEITAINGTQVNTLPQVNLDTFKQLTAGNPGDKIVFNVSNNDYIPYSRVVTIQLQFPPPPTPISAAAGIRRPDLRNDLRNKGGFNFKGGKKTTIRRKKQKKRKNTKKRKVMVGGVLPEDWDQYSITRKLSHASSNWKNYDQNEKIRFINELPKDNDADFKRRLGMLHNFEEIDIGHDKTSPVLDFIKSKLYESGPGAGRGRVDLPLSPRNLQRQPQPDIASVLLDSPRFSSSGLVSPSAESIPPPVSALPEVPSTHHIGFRGSPPDRPPPARLPPARPLKLQLQQLESQPPELQSPDLLGSLRHQVDPPKETTTDIIDIPIEPPEQQTVKPRTVVCECVPKPKITRQSSSSSSNLTKTQRMKNFASRLFTINKKTKRNKE